MDPFAAMASNKIWPKAESGLPYVNTLVKGNANAVL